MTQKEISGGVGAFMVTAAASLLDKTVAFAFGRPGYRLRARLFNAADTDVDLRGRVCLVTGANSGLGYETALALAARGAQVHLLCRDRGRGQEALERIRVATGHRDLVLHVADLASQKAIRAFVAGFAPERLDLLVNNAGVLPVQRVITIDGLELTHATNTLAPFLLTWLLRDRLTAAAQGRVVNVSSGGAYPQRLDLTDLLWEKRPFNGVIAYANSKRAMIILTRMWANAFRGTRVTINCMHPGWVDTAAVRASLPRFHTFMRPILRSPAEGADTMVWLSVAPGLATTSGQFFFDRRPVSPYKLPRTKERAQDREKLWARCLNDCSLAEL
jgi:NAD(P)-dependent dehydrogenase (short-subunit alcohol dehydrogenase family)